MTDNTHADYHFQYAENGELLSVHVYDPEPYWVGNFYRYPETLLGRLRMAWRVICGVSPVSAERIASRASDRGQEIAQFHGWLKDEIERVDCEIGSLILYVHGSIDRRKVLTDREKRILEKWDDIMSSIRSLAWKSRP